MEKLSRSLDLNKAVKQEELAKQIWKRIKEDGLKTLFKDLKKTYNPQAPKIFAYLLLKPDYPYNIATKYYVEGHNYASKLSALMDEMEKKGYIISWYQNNRRYYRTNPYLIAEFFNLYLDVEGLELATPFLKGIARLGPDNPNPDDPTDIPTLLRLIGEKKNGKKETLRKLDASTLIVFIADVLLEFIMHYEYLDYLDQLVEGDPDKLTRTYLNWENKAKLDDELREWINDALTFMGGATKTRDMITQSVLSIFTREFKSRGVFCDALNLHQALLPPP